MLTSCSRSGKRRRDAYFSVFTVILGLNLIQILVSCYFAEYRFVSFPSANYSQHDFDQQKLAASSLRLVSVARICLGCVNYPSPPTHDIVAADIDNNRLQTLLFLDNSINSVCASAQYTQSESFC